MPFEGTGIGTWTDYPTAAGNGTFQDLLIYSNTVTNDIFGIMLLISIFIVIFVAGSKRDSDTALASSMFITTILAYILVDMTVVANWIAILMTFLLMAAVIMLYRGGSKDV